MNKQTLNSLLALKQDLVAQAEQTQKARAAYKAHTSQGAAPTKADLDAIWASREEECTVRSTSQDKVLKDKYGI